jgi:hypothetical protein
LSKQEREIGVLMTLLTCGWCVDVLMACGWCVDGLMTAPTCWRTDCSTHSRNLGQGKSRKNQRPVETLVPVAFTQLNGFSHFGSVQSRDRLLEPKTIVWMDGDTIFRVMCGRLSGNVFRGSYAGVRVVMHLFRGTCWCVGPCVVVLVCSCIGLCVLMCWWSCWCAGCVDVSCCCSWTAVKLD